MPRPIHATIDLAALRHNYRLAKQRSGNARAWAVVKANAYGHGLLRAAKALRDEADGFALLDLEEAVALREAGIRQPILLLEGFFSPDDLRLVDSHRLSTAIHCREQIAMLAAGRLSAPLHLFVKFNTGMNRLGFVEGDLPWLREQLAWLPAASVTLMTHFADADGPSGIAWQLERFRAMTAGWPGAVSVSNSAATLRYPEAAADWVRPGIMLYGGSPFGCAAGWRAGDLDLRPAMTLRAEILGVQALQAGDTVGYGRSFRAEAPMRVGVVACGYADGYPRHAPTGTPVLVNGRRTRLLGRVSMDMLAVDLSALPEAGIGNPVTLWGEGLPADEVAQAAGTISYELFCALARRVPVSEAAVGAGGGA